METRNLTYNPRLDVLRFLAAASVVLHHFYQGAPIFDGKFTPDIWNILFIRGHIGVSLFMVMSGYLMASIFLKNPSTRYLDFIANRFIRIAPLCVLLFLCGLVVQDPSTILRTVAAFVTLQFNVVREGQIAPLWTIATEMQFYLLVPVLAAITRRNGIKSLFGLIAVVAGARLFVIAYAMSQDKFAYDIAYYTLLGRIDQFVIGMGVAYLPSGAWRAAEKPVHLPLAIGVVIAMLFLAAGNPWWDKTPYQAAIQSMYLTVEALACAYVLVSFLQYPWRIPGQAILASLGAASYSMYLLHELVIWMFVKAFPSYILGIRSDAVLLLLPAVCLISLASFHLFEKPFLSFRVKYDKNRDGT